MHPSPTGSAAPPGWPASTAGVSPARPSAGPSWWWFVVAGVVAVLGVAVGVAVIVAGVVGLADKVEDFDRAFMPTTLEVEITDPGGYSIYHEYDGLSSVELRDDPNVAVTDPAGNDVPLRPYGSSVSYGVSGHDGVGVYTFRADEPGTYEVQASMPFSDSSRDVIAVGRGLGTGLAVAIVAGIALIGVGVVGGVVIAIVVGVMRGRRRRAAMPPPVIGWGPPAGQWGPPAWPAGPAAPGWEPGPATPSAPGAWSNPAPPPPPPPPAPPQDAPGRDA